VSKWERGLNLPNAELFEPLCAELDISILELLRGERNTGAQIPVEEAERAVYDAAALARMKRERRKKLRWACVVIVCLLAIYGVMVWFAGRIAAADHPYPEVTVRKVGAGVTEIMSHSGACYTPESTDGREERLNELAIRLPADVTGQKKARTFECDRDSFVQFSIDYEIDGMEIRVLRWPEELRGTDVGLEDGENVPFAPCDSDAVYEWQFDVESGYLYVILVFWGEGYFVEYPFRTESIYQ
jgi:transcriptional regulator with XRE-family HTH domain